MSSRRDLEFDLLLSCARLRVDAQVERRITAVVAQELDWDFILTTAHQHRVLPLLGRNLLKIGADAIPPDAARRFRAAVAMNAKRNLFLTSELLQVLDLFAAHDVPCIPYKGPVLASRIYGDIALRQFADLDVIVPVDDAAQAIKLLVSRGYRPERVLSDATLRALIPTEKDVTLLRDDLGINLEIHWGITTEKDPIRIDPRLLWTELESHNLGGRAVHTHSCEDLLLICCVHGAKHRWEKLGWVCDVAEIVRSGAALNWTRTLERAATLGASRILLLGVALANDLLGATPPEAVVRRIEEDSALAALCRQLKQRLLSDGGVAADLGQREEYFMNLREHPADKLRVAMHQARTYLSITARDVESLPVPRFLTGLLYLVRPIRLAREYGLGPFKRFVRGIFEP